MMMSDDKVGGWVKKGQNHDDVILECPLMNCHELKLLFLITQSYIPNQAATFIYQEVSG